MIPATYIEVSFCQLLTVNVGGTLSVILATVPSDTVGEVLDSLKESGDLENYKGKTIVYHTNLGKVLDKVGRDETMIRVEDEAAKSMYDKAYEPTKQNIAMNWIHLGIFILLFSIASMISLLFVDKDKR